MRPRDNLQQPEDRNLWRGHFMVSTAPLPGLTRAAADSEAVLLRIKVIPVAPTAPKQEGNAAALLRQEVPPLQHGTTGA